MGLRAQIGLGLTLLASSAHAATGAADFRAQLDHLFAPGGLSSAEVATQAKATSYTLAERTSDRESAQATEAQSIIGFLPRAQLLARYTRFSQVTNPVVGNFVAAQSAGPVTASTPLEAVPIQFPFYVNQTTVQATFTVPVLDYVLRIPSVFAAARANRKVAQLGERAAKLEIATDAQLLYYTWVRARVAVVVAQIALEQSRQHLTAAAQRFDTGSAPKADMLRVQAQVATAELALLRARDQENIYLEQLHTSMHTAATPRSDIGEDVRQTLAPAPTENNDSLVQEAWKNRLDVRLLEDTIDAAHAQTRVAANAALPRVDAFADLLYADPNPRFFPQRDRFDYTWDVGVSLTFSPNDTAMGIAGAKAAAAKARGAVAHRNAMRDRVRNEVIATATAAVEADTAATTTQRGLDAAEESYRVRRELYTNGRATSVELTDAEAELTQARMEAIGARIDQRMVRVRLAHAVGRDVKN